MTGKKIPPLNSREFLADVRDIFGPSYLHRLFKITNRTLQRWVARGPFVSEDSIRENPVEKLEKILIRLMREPEGDGVARAMVSRLADIVGCVLHCKGDVEPDRDTLAEECLDDYPALAAYHEALQANENPDHVRHLMEEVNREVLETYHLYLKKLAKRKR